MIQLGKRKPGAIFIWLAIVLCVVVFSMDAGSVFAEGTGADPPILPPIIPPDSLTCQGVDTLSQVETVNDSSEWSSFVSWFTDIWN